MIRAGRKLYVYRPGGLVDVTDEARAAPEPRVHIQDDRNYQGLAVPGFDYETRRPKMVPLDSRTKHRGYMKARGLTHASDFDSPGGYWDRAAARRQRLREGTDPENNRKLEATVAEAARKVAAGYKPGVAERVDDSYAVVTPK